MLGEETGGADAIIAFFRSLPPAERRAYEALAALDQRFGEDVRAELRSDATGDRRDGP